MRLQRRAGGEQGARIGGDGLTVERTRSIAARKCCDKPLNSELDNTGARLFTRAQ